MRERLREAAAYEVGVEGVVAVLDEHGAAREAQETGPDVGEGRRALQHRALDEVALLRVAVDRRPALDERVVDGQRAPQVEPLGADLEDQEGPVAGGLDVQGHVLGEVERGVIADRVGFPLEVGEGHVAAKARLQPQVQ